MNSFLPALLLICSSAQAQYPISPMTDSADTWFGKKYPDPYRWMEYLEKPETISWFKAQDDYAIKTINTIPLVQTIYKENQDADKIRSVKYGAIYKKSGQYFFQKRLPSQQKFRLFMMDSKGVTQDLFNPETYAGGKFELNSWAVADDGKTIALNLTEPGKEIGNIYLMDTRTKKFTGDSIINSSSANWLPKSNRFFYYQHGSSDVHSMDATMNTKLMLFDGGKKTEILSTTNNPTLGILPEEYPSVYYFPKGNYLLAGRETVERNAQFYYAPVSELTSGKINWKPFCTRADKIVQAYVRGDNVYALTVKDNPGGDLYKYSLTGGEKSTPVKIYSADKEVVQSLSASNNYLYVQSNMRGITTMTKKIDLKNGALTDLPVPLKGMVYASPWDEESDDLDVVSTSWTDPYNHYNYNASNEKLEKSVFYTSLKVPGIENLVSEEVDIISHDGTKVPLSIVYDKTKFKKDGSNICYLDGYGAYGMSSTPYFSFTNLSMLRRGVVLAFAHIRGGGELGEDWHLAGFKTTKANTWKDFIAAGEYLVNQKYTSSDRLAGTGTSAGGILIGRAITERPDLFKAAIPRVGCMNTLRLEFSPNGPVNVPEFGTVKIEDEAKALAEMDALSHVVKGVKYPAMLISTGFNDPRVISWSPGKFAAAVQNSTSSGLPVLLKVNYAGGHFGGANVNEFLHDDAVEKAFILWQCGYKGD